MIKNRLFSILLMLSGPALLVWGSSRYGLALWNEILWTVVGVAVTGITLLAAVHWIRRRQAAGRYGAILQGAMSLAALATLILLFSLPQPAQCAPLGACSCTSYDQKPCSGWTSWGTWISCSSSGVSHDGFSCLGCCFDYACAPTDTPEPPAATATRTPTATPTRTPSPTPTPTPTPLPPVIQSAAMLCDRWGENSWCVENARLRITASDPAGSTITISGSAGGTTFTCGADCTVTLAEGAGTAAFTVASTSGRSVSGSLAFAFDPTAPQVVAQVTGTAGLDGWYTSLVSVEARGTDATSGMAAVEISRDNGQTWQSSVDFNSEGRHDVLLRARDRAGNLRTTQETVKVDWTAPNLVLNPSGLVGDAGWYRSPVTVVLQASDMLSGVGQMEYRLDTGGWQPGGSLTLQDGVYMVEGHVFDQAGNAATARLNVRVDTVPPALSLTLPPVDGANGWYLTRPELVFSALDDTSGLAALDVRLDQTGWQSATSLVVPEGSHQVDVHARDVAGNITTENRTVQVDLTDPALSILPSGATGLDDWYRSDVRIVLDAADSGSGLALTEFQLDGGAWMTGNATDISKEGVHVLDARASDQAGRQAMAGAAIKIDKTAPGSRFVSPPDGSSGTVVKGALVLSGQSADALSGLHLVELSFDDGKSWQALEPVSGEWTYFWDTRRLANGVARVLVRGTDLAGNMEAPRRIEVILANQPPKVSVQESWLIWESGEVRVQDAGLPIDGLRVTIRDPQGRWPAVVQEYSLRNMPGSITWNRRFSDGTLAPSGEYEVVVEAWDGYSNLASDKGVIVIPFAAGATVTTTPGVTPSPSPSATEIASPLGTAVPTKVIKPSQVVMPTAAPAIQPAPAPVVEKPVISLSFWPVVGLLGLMLALASAAVADGRPRALARMKETFNQIMKNQGE